MRWHKVITPLIYTETQIVSDPASGPVALILYRYLIADTELFYEALQRRHGFLNSSYQSSGTAIVALWTVFVL